MRKKLQGKLSWRNTSKCCPASLNCLVYRIIHREHLEQDDQEVEKLHKDVIEGKLRIKRRNRGIGLDDSDEDDEDDDAARSIRKQMNKKRKIDGDNLDALGQYPIRICMLN